MLAQFVSNIEKGFESLETWKTVDGAETTYEYVTGLNMFVVASERVGGGEGLMKEVKSKTVKLLR